MPARSDVASAQWNLAAAIAGWAVPGLGHALLGQRRRGLILGVTIGLLWVGGLLIGGVGAIDHQRHFFWFLGQAMIAPSLAVDWYVIGQLHPVQFAGPEAADALGYQPGFAHAGEQGVLYTSLAGLLNLLVILDVLYRDPADPRHQPEAAGEAAS